MHFSLLISIFAMLLLSCTEHNEVEHASFSVTPTVLNVMDVGGDYEVHYTLKDAKGINPVAIADAEWICDIDNSTAGIIRFRVLPNNSDTPREATITLRHTSTSETPSCIIKQSATHETHITLEVTKLDYSECEVSITPYNKELRYIVMMAERSYLTGMNITNAEELVATDMSVFNSYLSGDKSLEEFLTESKIALQGDIKRVWQDLSPARDYVIYAYGVYLHDDVYERITPVSYIVVDDRLPERSTEHFEVEIAAEGPEVAFNISPTTWEGYYAVQIIEDSEAGYI